MKFIALIIKVISKTVFYRESKKFVAILKKNYLKYQTEKSHTDENIIIMLIVAEDHRFFKHGGIDPLAIVRAVTRIVFFGKIEGGSTIEQQLVRTITADYQKTIKRKFKEIIFASLVSEVVEKKNVPGFYLSVAYYGYGMLGYNQAIKKLNLNTNFIKNRDRAEIIARLKYPEPLKITIKRKNQINKRANHIIKKFNLITQGYNKLPHNVKNIVTIRYE